ncbi:sugar phosphate isomerase/epimerase family protein [Flavimarina sp. Hel_I_48]|uniref:sugar phosphate isomerase/epimerase family protein n=1 Tax=Flavimarina sp. Hel_I_48 TaxID=1392488 RepID=UPI0004DF8A7F|nr:sugar phosphate isomerase/epimerase [Flavimarina sp. Hel_I_48]
MSQRRTFLKQATLAAAAATLLPKIAFASVKKHKLGLQLYSLRETLPDNVKGTLEMVAKIGFKEVETYGYTLENGFWGTTIEEFNQILKDTGMKSPSGHYGADSFLAPGGTKDELMHMIEAAEQLNQKYFIIPYLGDSLRGSLDDYKRLAPKFNEIGELCKQAGLKLAYHNHAFEFEKYDGQTGYEILLSETDKELVDFEMDIFWVAHSGVDPVALFNKYPGRFPLWHVKDMDKADRELNTEIGAGTIDYTTIFKNMKTSDVKHLIIEQENFDMDPYKSLSQSVKYIENDLLTS